MRFQDILEIQGPFKGALKLREESLRVRPKYPRYTETPWASSRSSFDVVKDHLGFRLVPDIF